MLNIALHMWDMSPIPLFYGLDNYSEQSIVDMLKEGFNHGQVKQKIRERCRNSTEISRTENRLFFVTVGDIRFGCTIITSLVRFVFLDHSMSESDLVTLFDKVKELVPAFAPDFFMSDDAASFRRVFPNAHTRKILCNWHVLQAFKRSARKKLTQYSIQARNALFYHLLPLAVVAWGIHVKDSSSQQIMQTS
ncbi:hypothetical protein COOONC_28019 [Cooperia oncophora]